MISPPVREKIIRNFQKHLGQYQPKTTDVCVFQKLTPELLCDLLDNASPLCKQAAKELLVKMSTVLWTIKASPKEGGFDAATPLHITVDVPINNRAPAYHLNCKEVSGGLQITSISQQPKK